MEYISTRGGCLPTDFRGALMQGLAPDGGLYVPAAWPQLTPPKPNQTYIDTAASVLTPFMDGFTDEPTLRTLLKDAYASFSTPDVTPLKPLAPNFAVLELFHGPTIAFKDVALQLLGRLFDYQLKKTGQRITILGATSGDTGSAAIEGCRHATGADIHILYPHERPSDVQRRQMTTVHAPNVHAHAVRGNFDDCQAIVKALFADEAFRTAKNLSAVNSINWARIAAQAVYYVQAAYSHAEPVTFIVPTGNFGNVYAAYVAKNMGAPIKRLVVASNRNDILTRFFETGKMQVTGVESSLSPSMDIQVSSNFERLLFDALGRDAKTLAATMADFKKTGNFVVPPATLSSLRNTFTGVRCSDDDTLTAIACAERDYGYVIDPHTACAFHAYEELKETLGGPVVALACAHPAKFPEAVEKATGKRPQLPEALADLMEREERFDILENSIDTVKKALS
ncbi:MAG: threonine synthase [Proteobacteria bacterium]|nr:threonine synthase [Pseudomonadota bacterium]